MESHQPKEISLPLELGFELRSLFHQLLQLIFEISELVLHVLELAEVHPQFSHGFLLVFIERVLKRRYLECVKGSRLLL